MKTKSRFTRVAIATGLIVAIGAASLGITSFASAQMNGNEPSAAVVQVTQTTTPTASHDGHGGSKVSPIETAATELGMTKAELITELKAGKSISEIAATKNVDLATVKAALTAALKTHLDAGVVSGMHTQAQADAKLAKALTRFDTLVTTPGLMKRHEGKGSMGEHGMRGRGSRVSPVETAAVALGMTKEELVAELKAGKSISEIAATKNVDLATVKAALTAALKTHLDAGVVSGMHTQAQADAKLAEASTWFDTLVTTPGLPQRHEGKGAMGDHSMRGKGMGGHGPMNHSMRGNGPMGGQGMSGMDHSMGESASN